MAKILSALTLLFALGATYLGFESKGRVEKLQASSRQEHADLEKTTADLKKTKETLKGVEEELAEAKSEVEKTKETLRTTEADLTKAKGDLAAAVAQHDQTKAELDTLKKQIAEMTPADGGDLKAQIDAMKTQMTDLENKNRELEIVKAELTTRVETLQDQRKELDSKVSTQATVINRYEKGIMRQGISGRVLAVNAGWGFCVLSIGDRQGAAANKIMIVSRGGQAIGKVKITNVETSQSVADIIPSSFVAGTYVQPGDSVIFPGETIARQEQATDAGATPASGGSAMVPALPQL